MANPEIQVSQKLRKLIEQTGCTGKIHVWPTGTTDNMWEAVRVDIFHNEEPCPVHEKVSE